MVSDCSCVCVCVCLGKTPGDEGKGMEEEVRRDAGEFDGVGGKGEEGGVGGREGGVQDTRGREGGSGS